MMYFSEQISAMEISVPAMTKKGRIELFVDEENILHVTSIGDIDVQTALECQATALKLTDHIPGKVSILVDVNRAGKESHEARQVWKNMKYEKDADVAMFGIHPVAKFVATLYMKFAKIKNVRFFSTKEEALAWLRAMK